MKRYLWVIEYRNKRGEWVPYWQGYYSRQDARLDKDSVLVTSRYTRIVKYEPKP